MAKNTTLTISDDSWLEICNIGNGTFAPLDGFMNKTDYRQVVDEMHLANGRPWTIPITLDLPEEYEKSVGSEDILTLNNQAGDTVAKLTVTDIFKVDFDQDIKKVFGTTDPSHPGVAMELSRSSLRVAGPIQVIKEQGVLFPELAFTPAQTKEAFKEKGWKTIAGFQTRNPIHRAHEYLQRVAMELCDGVFLQPLIGWKKADDFSPLAVVKAYQAQICLFYPANSAFLGVLRTPMRYAGPREAVFHAIIRRNHGCTHFIVGRDHAGVGDFYGKYEAQELCAEFTDLGIEILALKGPYCCTKCEGIVTEQTCRHGTEFEEAVSGTRMRALLSDSKRPPEAFMRKDIADVLIGLAKEDRLFVGENK